MYRIMLVDDEREEREGIEFLIHKYRYPLEIVSAANGAKALEYLECSPADILFTDVKMPVMNGLELAKEVSKRWPDTMIIIFSAYGEFDYAKQAMEANAVNYLLKPIELEEFRKVMEAVLEKLSRAERQKEKSAEADARNRSYILYKLLTGAHLAAEERTIVDAYLFGGKGRYRLLHVESESSFFEQKEELFLNFMKMYLGQSADYVNLFPNESCIFLREEKYLDSDYLEGQLLKIIRDVKNFVKDELTITVSRIITSMEELDGERILMEEIGSSIFGVESMILWTEKEMEQKYFSRDAEQIGRQIVLAAKAKQPEQVTGYVDKLVSVVSDNKSMSRIYVTNLFYSVIREIYELAPEHRLEKVRSRADDLFLYGNDREIVEMFRDVIHTLVTNLSQEMQDESAMISRIRRIIENEYMNDIGLNEIAERVNLAPAYVSCIFKRETGKTLIKYLTEVRMDKAKMMLEEGKAKMHQVAKACGYVNPSYFNRAFKNYYGTTPKQYKER